MSKPQFWHYPAARSPSLAVRIDEWKFMSNPEGRLEELYNLADDAGETTNLAGDRPDKVKSMKDMLLNWYHELPIAKGSTE